MNLSIKLLFPLGLWVLILTGCSSSSQEQVSGAEGNSPNNYTVEVNKKDPSLTTLFLNYSAPLPSPEKVDKSLMEEMEKAVKENSDIDILGLAFIGDDELTSKQYSGSLVYVASKKKIMTFKEYEKLNMQ